jgi:predicted dehydrogenase
VESVRGFVPGSAPDAASAAAGRAGERSVLVVARYREGAIGTLHYGWDIPSPWRGLRLSRVFGAEGSVTFESNGLFVWLYGHRKRLIVPGLRDIAGYRAMFRDFLDALRTGREPAFTLARARRDLELVEDVYRDIGAAAPQASA